MSTFPRDDDHFSSAVTALALDEFLAKPLPPRETLLAPWLPKAGLAMIYAPRGLGKTQTAMGTAWAVASGSGFLRWKCKAAWRVPSLDGEMPGADLQARFKAVTTASNYTLADPDYLKIAASDLMPFGFA
jgi:hypothetical protein